MEDCNKAQGLVKSHSSKPDEAAATYASPAAKGIAGIHRYLQIPIWLLSLLLIGAVIIAYQPVWHAGFIWDDDTFLFNNPLIKQSNGLYQFWFTTKAPDYFPMTSTTLWLEWRLWGTNPLGYHIVNVLLHALSTILIWRVLTHLKMPGAWLAAALFAVHPVNVESVAWITERKNTLAMLFYVTSVFFYLRFEDTNRWPWYGIALGSFVLALLSKTAVAPLPIVLLGLVWWQNGRITKKDILNTLPFFGVALLLGLITVWFQSHNAIGADVVRTDNLWSRLAGAGWAIWFYLYKVLFPFNLLFVYPKWQIDATKLLSYMPLLLFLAAAVILWRYRKSWGKALFLGLGYFVVMLLPVLGFLDIYFMRYSLVADHWQYFAIIGPIGLVAAGITTAFDSLKKKNVFIIPVFSTILLIGLAFLTWKQTCNYSDAETLWKITIAKNPACWMAHNNMGLILDGKGQLDKAISHYQEVIRLNPNYADAYSNRGDVYKQLGRYQTALEDFNQAIRLKPDFAVFYNNRGGIYDGLKQYQLALEDYNKAIRLEPNLAIAYYNRGGLYEELEQYQLAFEDFNEAIRREPDLTIAYYRREKVYNKLRLRQYQLALEEFNESIRLKPNDADAYFNRAHIHFIQGNKEKGCIDAQKACKLGNCKILETAKKNRTCR